MKLKFCLVNLILFICIIFYSPDVTYFSKQAVVFMLFYAVCMFSLSHLKSENVSNIKLNVSNIKIGSSECFSEII